MFDAYKKVFDYIVGKQITLAQMDLNIAAQVPEAWHTTGAEFIYQYIQHAYPDGNWSYAYGRINE